MYVQQSEIVGFEIVGNGNVNYLPGQAYDKSKIKVNAVYGNGRTESISLEDDELVVDSSAYDSATPGVYEISVKYRNYDAQKIEVVVYDVEDITLGFNRTEKVANSSAGNGVYFNQTVQRIYELNATQLETKDLTVTVMAVHPTDNTKTMTFIADSKTYTVSGFDTTTVGKKTITVSYGTAASATFDVYVVDTTPSVVENVVQVKVDQNYTGVIGAVADGYNMFTSVQQALDYLELHDELSDKRKEVHLAAGTYKEKIEITLPFLSIIGADKETTMIEWDSLYGLPDESGFLQITDSTQTVAVRDTAINCIIEGVTISNYWNSLAHFDEKFGPGYQEHRALAILIQADQFKMNDCKLLGYQDTIELMTGRQLITNTYICGTTDFIFGTNNTTYFKGCTIHSITAEQSRGEKSDGGYITAFKGDNKGGDYVQYGAIFDQCNFTADADIVADGNTAIGRPWGAYAAVMVMNSTIDGHVSKTGYTSGAGKNARYVNMNAEPTVSTTKFTEYNNTGAGAISESVAGCTVLTDATVAANYADYSVIFGKTNGNVTYTAAWDPTDDTIAEDFKSYYIFNGQKNPTGTSYLGGTDIALNSQTSLTATLGDMTLDATNGNIAYNSNANALNMKQGAKLVINVEAGTSVTVSTYTGYSFIAINGVETSKDLFTQYFAEATVVEIVSTGDAYVYSVTIDPKAEAPEAATLTSISVTDYTTEFLLNTDFTTGDMVVKATYSDGSVKVLEASDYTVDSTAVDKTTEGTYTVKVTFEDKEFEYNVEYAETFDTVLHASAGISFKGTMYQNEVKNVLVLDTVIDATAGTKKVNNFFITGAKSNNSATNWLVFGTGNTIVVTVDRACTLKLSFYANSLTDPNEIVEVKLGDTVIACPVTSVTKGAGTIVEYAIETEGTITIKGLVSDYLGFVGVDVPLNLAETQAAAKAELDTLYPAANYTNNPEYATVLAEQKAAIDAVSAKEDVADALEAAKAVMDTVKTNDEIAAETVVSVEVTNIPTVEVGATADLSGIVVTATYADNHTAVLEASAYTLSAVDTSAVGDVTVTLAVTGTDVTEEFVVTVVAEVEKYSITYVTTVGTAPEVAEELTAIPAELPVLTDDADLNEFDAWYLDAEFTTKAVGNTLLTEDVTLYAHWYTLAELKEDLVAEVNEAYADANYTEYGIADLRVAALAAVDATTTVTDFYNVWAEQKDILDAVISDAQIQAASTTYSFVSDTTNGAYLAPADNVFVYDGNDFDGVTITGTITSNNNSYKFATAGSISFDVPENTGVIINGFKGYSTYGINGRYAKDTYTTYYTETTTVTVDFPKNNYIVSIVISPLAKPQEEATINAISVEAKNKQFNVGDEFELGDLVVNAIYTDKSYSVLANTDYTVDSSAVDTTTGGTYEVVVTYGEFETTYEVKVIADVTTYIEGELSVSFKDDTTNATSTYLVYDDSAIDGSLQIGKFTLVDNGQGVVANNGDWLKFNTGAKVQFEVATSATLAISFYQDNNNVMVSVDGTEITVNGDGTYTLPAGKVEIEAIANGYLGKVSVNAGYLLTKDVTVSFKDDTTNATESYIVYDDSAINGSLQIGKFTLVDNGQGVVANNGDWLKFNTGGKVLFNVPAKSTLAISFYQDNNNVKVTVDGTEITANSDGTYTLPAGEVVIEAISNGYLGKISVQVPPVLTESCTVSFKDDTTNATESYLVYDDSAIDGSLQIGKFTLVDNGQGVVANNGDWLKFNTGGKVVIYTKAASTLAISFYQNNNNVKVTVDGIEITANSDGTYTLPAGEVVIEAISNGYLGNVSVSF